MAITVGASLLIWTALPHTANQAPVALQMARAPMADGEAPAAAVTEAQLSEGRSEGKLAMKPAAGPASTVADAARKLGPESYAMKSQGKASSNDLAKSKGDSVDALQPRSGQADRDRPTRRSDSGEGTEYAGRPSGGRPSGRA